MINVPTQWFLFILLVQIQVHNSIDSIQYLTMQMKEVEQIHDLTISNHEINVAEEIVCCGYWRTTKTTKNKVHAKGIEHKCHDCQMILSSKEQELATKDEEVNNLEDASVILSNRSREKKAELKVVNLNQCKLRWESQHVIQESCTIKVSA